MAVHLTWSQMGKGVQNLIFEEETPLELEVLGWADGRELEG